LPLSSNQPCFCRVFPHGEQALPGTPQFKNSNPLPSSTLVHTTDAFLRRKSEQGDKLWSYILWSTEHPTRSKLCIRDLFELAYIIKDGIQSTLSSGFLLPPNPSTNEPPSQFVHKILSFYNTPELHRKQIKYSKSSLNLQLQAALTNPSINHSISPNHFHLLDLEDTPFTIIMSNVTASAPSSNKTVPTVSPNGKKNF